MTCATVLDGLQNHTDKADEELREDNEQRRVTDPAGFPIRQHQYSPRSLQEFGSSRWRDFCVHECFLARGDVHVVVVLQSRAKVQAQARSRDARRHRVRALSLILRHACTCGLKSTVTNRMPFGAAVLNKFEIAGLEGQGIYRVAKA